MPKRERTRLPRARKPKAKGTSEAPAALKYTPWDSPETLAGVTTATRQAASHWHFIAACTSDPIAHETARMKAMILDAVARGDAACLRVLAARAATELARQSGARDAVGFRAVRSAAFDEFHFSIVLYLVAPIPPHLVPAGGLTTASVIAAMPNVGMREIDTATIARHMVTMGRHLPEIGQMLALHCPELFPLPDKLDGRERLTPGWVNKLAAALDRKRGITDVSDAAEQMIVQFLLTVGVPERKARTVWDYRKKRVKRGSTDGKRRTD